MDDRKIHILQRSDEIHRILRNMVKQPGDVLGVAFGIVTEVSGKSKGLPSWTIRIDDARAVLTSDILLRYMNEHTDLKVAIACFMRERFPTFASFF
ncbi:hypothetical protein [Paenibacillus sp.]|uniref:hypothetical protein n=1 Tax=Paenibacillus sp. TaxID=58172 RepID=UPI002811BBF9|nr:hypothetical protein [Paenibacillus sp.]